jgi:hypothetical protein
MDINAVGNKKKSFNFQIIKSQFSEKLKSVKYVGSFIIKIAKKGQIAKIMPSKIIPMPAEDRIVLSNLED